MNRHAKASSAGSIERSGKRRVGDLLGILALALCVLGSGASAASAAPPVLTMGTASAPSYASAHVTGEVDPEGEAVEWFFEISTNGIDWQRAEGTNVGGGFFDDPKPTDPQPVAGDLGNLKGGTTYKVRLSAVNFGASCCDTVSSAAPYPEVTTLAVDPPAFVAAEEASSVAYTTAKATGEVERPSGNTDPAFDVNCRFEYISDQQFNDNLNASEPGFANAASADCAENPITEEKAEAETEGPKVDVSADLSGLNVNTTYHLRLHAENAGGALNADAPSTFTTLNPSAPVVTIDPVTTFDATTAHFSGHVTPGGSDQVFATDWEFHCSPLPCPGLSGHLDPVGSGTTPEEVKFDVKGLEPNTAYQVELSATNAGGTTAAGPVSFTTSASAPVVTTLQAFPLEGATSALLGGNVNPHNSATTYWVEYGPTAAYGQSTPHEPAGSGGTVKLVSQTVTGLMPGATYHFSLVAEGAGSTIHGDDVTFTMPVPASPESCDNAQYRVGASAALPDCRAYELVTPPDAHISAWSFLDDSFRDLLQPWGAVASDGSAVLWRAESAVPGIPEASGQFDAYRSVRGPDSWQSRYAGPPTASGSQAVPRLQFASTDVNRLLVQTFNASIDPADHDPVPSPSEASPGNAFQYRDLYTTGADGTITHVNRGSIEIPAPEEEPIFVGASEDLREVLFTTNRQLVPGAPSGGERSTYWTDGQTTELVSKDETGTPLLQNTFNVNSVGISADGLIAVFTTNPSGHPNLYFWSAQSKETVKAIGPLPQDAGISVDSISPDGQLIFFTTRAALSADDTDTSLDLYEYDASTDQVTLLSALGGALGNSDACVAPLPGEAHYSQCDISPVIESPDGSVAYFVSPEQIVPGHGVDGGVNLYRAAGGDIRFVASLDPSDPIYRGIYVPGGDLVQSIGTRQVRLTPDGSKLVFMSRAALTSYDNAGFTEIYLYDQASGAIVCASCRADGAPPTTDSSLFSYDGAGQPLIGGFFSLDSANADTHGDRLFFNSGDAIVPQDVNGKNDVYEYTVATGTPSLISTGRSEVDSAYAGSGLDGRDVFFFTADSLVPQDQNGAVYKVYDARRGGGFPAPPVPPAPCDGEGCHGSPSPPPAAASSATSTFSAPGNPVQLRCKKGTRRVRSNGKTRCAKKQKKHHHKRDAKHNRGAGR